MYKHVTGWLMSKILDWYCKYSVVITCTVDTLKHILNSDQFILIKLYRQICIVVESCHRSEDCFKKEKRRKKTITHKKYKVIAIIQSLFKDPSFTRLTQIHIWHIKSLMTYSDLKEYICPCTVIEIVDHFSSLWDI